MIRVVGDNPVTVLKRAAHHAHRLLPLIEALSLALLYESRVGSDNQRHIIRQSKAGANSFGLYLADGREFHFRGHTDSEHYDAIAVYDRWTYNRDGVAPVAILRSVDECRAWAQGLRSNPFIARAQGNLVTAAA